MMWWSWWVGCALPEGPVFEERVLDEQAPALFVRRAWVHDEDPALVLVHGGPGSGSDYLRSLEGLARHGVQVVSWDQRAAGRSEAPADDDHQDLPHHVADLHRVVSSLQSDTVVVLGHSWGGLVAQAYAEAHPASVDGLILTGSLGPTTTVNDQVRMAIRRAGKAASDRGLPPPPGPLGAGCDRHWHVFVAYYADPARIRARDLPRHCDSELNQQVWRSVADYDIDLTGLHAPVLALWGETDPVRIAIPALYDSLPPHTRFHMLPNCGHRPMFECPALFDAEVLALLEAATERSAADRAPGPG